jgi:hypothetical protein
VISSDFVSASNGTSATAYGDLGTTGPTVTVTTGPQAIALFACQMDSATLSSTVGRMSIAVSGATTVAANDNWCFEDKYTDTGITGRKASFHLFTGLTNGSNTFQAKYRVNANSATFANRELVVIAL